MFKTYTLGNVGGLQLSARPIVLIGTLILWMLLTFAFSAYFSPPLALIGGLASSLLYWVGDILHNAGHAIAARRTGHPMKGILFGVMWVLGASIYPKDEGKLPASVHVRRALGGPISSLIASVVSGLLAWALSSTGGLVYGIVLTFFLMNLLIFTVGSLLPLGFTDGSTLLKYWGK